MSLIPDTFLSKMPASWALHPYTLIHDIHIPLHMTVQWGEKQLFNIVINEYDFFQFERTERGKSRREGSIICTVSCI